MEHDERIPGVTFFVEEATQNPTNNPKLQARGRVVLEADIVDDKVWDVVTKKLDGWRVYEGADLSQAMIEAAQLRRKRAEEEAEKLKTEYQRELETLRQRNSFLEEENRRLLKEKVELERGIHQALKPVDELEAALADLKKA